MSWWRGSRASRAHERGPGIQVLAVYEALTLRVLVRVGLEGELGGFSIMRVHEGAEWLRLRHRIQGRA